MIKKNDDLCSPLRYILDDGRTIGQFYNSYDRTYHLAEYVPYKVLPSRYLCGGRGNFSGSREDYDERVKCKKCFETLLALDKMEK